MSPIELHSLLNPATFNTLAEGVFLVLGFGSLLVGMARMLAEAFNGMMRFHEPSHTLYFAWRVLMMVGAIILVCSVAWNTLISPALHF